MQAAQMPLLATSLNIRDASETPCRKRSHQDYLDQDDSRVVSKAHSTIDAENIPFSGKTAVREQNTKAKALEHLRTEEEQGQLSPSRPVAAFFSVHSPESDSPLSLITDADSSITPAGPSPSPNPIPSTPSILLADQSPRLSISIDFAMQPQNLETKHSISQDNDNSTMPLKRKRLSPAEKEEKAKVEAERKLEKEKAEAARKLEKERVEAAKRQEREEQKAAADAEKKARAEEREKKRKQKEEEDRKRAEEKEKKRREKEEEERKIQEAKEKKERSQLRLNSFFKTGAPSTPKKTATPVIVGIASPNASSHSHAVKSSPNKAAAVGLSEYDRMFKPFFIKENVIMATSLYGMDDETKDIKSKILDEYLSGSRGPFIPPAFSSAASEYFHLCNGLPRGRKRPTVRKIMAMMSDYNNTEDPQTKMALGFLKTIPMKFLGFKEDVRPAYYGTATNIPPGSRLKRLARNPLAKTVIPLDYDYDSEAEWVDDGDGEDVDDLDEEEEEIDEDEEMADFLDDSEDAAPLRPAFSGGMEPESTGICWEGSQGHNSQPGMDAFRMEFMLDVENHGALDPFSAKYWQTAPSETAPTTNHTGSSAAPVAMAPPPVPMDAFAALGCAPTPTSAAAAATSAAPPATGIAKADSKKAGVAAEFVGDLKRAIMQYSKLSKVGIIEILSSEFEKCTKSQIKSSLETMAERTGAGNQKTWKLKEGFAI